MNRYKNFISKIALFTFLMLAVITLSACNLKESELSNKTKQNTTEVVIDDQLGRKITIEKAPKRIVSLSPSNTEIIYALDLEDNLIAVTDFCNFPEEVQEKEKVGGFAEPNIEKLISLKPDLVLATSIHQKPVEQMEKLGIPAIVLDPKDINGMLESIQIIGKATGCDHKTEVLLKTLTDRIESIEEKCNRVSNRPKVYYELWPAPITTVGPGTFVHDIIERTGGINIAADADKSYPEYNQEMLISKNPDIIIFSHHGASQISVDDILKRPGWQNINAIKENKVYYVDENIIQRPTPRLVDGLETVAKILHPEIFKQD